MSYTPALRVSHMYACSTHSIAPFFPIHRFLPFPTSLIQTETQKTLRTCKQEREREKSIKRKEKKYFFTAAHNNIHGGKKRSGNIGIFRGLCVSLYTLRHMRDALQYNIVVVASLSLSLSFSHHFFLYGAYSLEFHAFYPEKKL
jgi:hypothetical protein